MKKFDDITGKDRSIDEMMEDVLALRGSPGGPYNGDMEARVAKLEAHLEHIRQDTSHMKSNLQDVRERFIGLEVKVDHLPAKGFLVTTVLGALAVISSLIMFQEQIRSFISQ